MFFRMFKQNIICFCILLLAIFTFPKTTLSYWQYYSGNPVLSPSADSWDNQSVTVPSVIYDENKFRMWYQGNGIDSSSGFGLAESIDGLNWQKQTISPLLFPQFEIGATQLSIQEPVVIKSDIYRMWYASTDDIGQYHIQYATSMDGTNWVKHPGYVLSGTESWENHGVTNPFVIYKDDQYWMWYQAWGTGNWKIGFAQSIDGINWQKYPGNPLNLPSLGADGGPAVIYRNGKFHLWYNTFTSTISRDVWYATSNDGINWSCLQDCHPFTINSSGFNSQMIFSHRPVLKNQDLFIYFGASDGITTQIGLYQWIEEKIPIVIVPGIFASWNKNALLYNQTVNQADWKLFSGVKEYNGIINTLKNLGYAENQNYFVFPYDWRKSIEQTSDDLNNFLQQNILASHPDQKIYFIGHSLGGLVARIYEQKYSSAHVKKLVTVGTSHQGVVQVYKPLSAGELDRENTLLWLAQKIIIFLNKTGIQTDKITLQTKFPVLYDLFPVFDFLQDGSGNILPTNSLSISNNLLRNYDLTSMFIFPYLSTLYGEGTPTLSGYQVEARNDIDHLLDNYLDGHPVNKLSDNGDQTVLLKSSQYGDNRYNFSLRHGELIAKKEPIKKTLDLINVKYDESQIAEGGSTQISPSLIFFIKSPVQLQIMYNNQEYLEKEEGIIFLENAQPGTYRLNVYGKDLGEYEIDVLQIAENNEVYETISGEITADPPTSQTDSYSFFFDSQNAANIFPDPTPTFLPTPMPTIEATLTPISTPTQTPTLIPTSTPTPIITIYLSPTLSPTANAQSTYLTQNTNNITAPTIIINNNNQQIYPANNIRPIITKILAKKQVEEVLGTKTESNNLPLEKATNKNENSLNNLWRIIIIITAVTAIGYYFYKFKKIN